MDTFILIQADIGNVTMIRTKHTAVIRKLQTLLTNDCFTEKEIKPQIFLNIYHLSYHKKLNTVGTVKLVITGQLLEL